MLGSVGRTVPCDDCLCRNTEAYFPKHVPEAIVGAVLKRYLGKDASLKCLDDRERVAPHEQPIVGRSSALRNLHVAQSLPLDRKARK